MNSQLYLYMISLPDTCRSLKDIENEPPRIVKPGSTTKLVARDTNACRYGNTSYVLQYQNQTSGELERLDIQKNYSVETPPIYMNNSGMYCVYKQCGTVEMEQCCAKVTG